MATAVSGKVINITVNSTQLTLVEEGSVSFDAGESVNDFEYAAEMVSESFHEVASPTLEFTLATDEAAAEGLTELGIADADGNWQVSGSRRLSSVTVEYLDGPSGSVEFTLDIPAATAQFGALDGQEPTTYDVTLNINEAPSFTPPTNTA